jgi:UDP-N-acetylglucosamine 2-epimerase (non-hydrolysing)
VGELRVVDLVAGARPNFMKVAPILRAMRSGEALLAPRLVHTGQHYDEGMSGVFFRDLGIGEPEVSLGVGSGSHGQQTARILAAYEEHLVRSSPRPVAVVVVGDVNSTMACTLAAVKLGIPVAQWRRGCARSIVDAEETTGWQTTRSPTCCWRASLRARRT